MSDIDDNYKQRQQKMIKKMEETKLKKTLKKMNLTGRDLAKITGDHESIVSKILNGKMEIDSLRKIRYAKALKRKPEELFS